MTLITIISTSQTNGLTERFNQTLSRSLAKITEEAHEDWDVKLDTVLMGYRASRQASTKFSPYYMLFQKEMRLPIHTEVGPDLETQSEQDDPKQKDSEVIMEELLIAREQAFKKAEENIMAAQKTQKETYDRKHQPKVLPVGTRVLLENTKQKQRKGGKLEPLWLGPYTISKDLGKGLYELSTQAGKVLKTKANIARLKEYQERASEDSKSPSVPPNSQLSPPAKRPRHHYQEYQEASKDGKPPSGPPNSQLSPPAKRPRHHYQEYQEQASKDGKPPSGPPNSQLSVSLRPTKLSTLRPTKLPPAKRPCQRKQHRADMWVKDLDLRHIDKDVIAAKTGMLSDKHMYAAHKLLRLQFPHLEGCYTTLLVQKMSYPPVTSEHCSGIIYVRRNNHFINATTCSVVNLH